MTGNIPNFTDLPNLIVLNLSGNQLTGTIPNFTSLPNLKRLYVSWNELSGEISTFNFLPNLETFIFNGNKIVKKDINCNAVTQISKIECDSLLQLYHSTNGINWRNDYGWNIICPVFGMVLFVIMVM